MNEAKANREARKFEAILKYTRYTLMPHGFTDEELYVLLVFNIASQPIDIATESWFVGKDVVKPSDMCVVKSNHHAHIHQGE